MNTATANKLITCNSIPKDAVTILHTILIEIVAIIVIVDVDLAKEILVKKFDAFSDREKLVCVSVVAWFA